MSSCAMMCDHIVIASLLCVYAAKSDSLTAATRPHFVDKTNDYIRMLTELSEGR